MPWDRVCQLWPGCYQCGTICPLGSQIRPEIVNRVHGPWLFKICAVWYFKFQHYHFSPLTFDFIHFSTWTLNIIQFSSPLWIFSILVLQVLKGFKLTLMFLFHPLLVLKTFQISILVPKTREFIQSTISSFQWSLQFPGSYSFPPVLL